MKLEMYGTPPRPADGNGDVIVDADGTSVILTWHDGKVTAVKPVADDIETLDGRMTVTNDLTGSTFSCIKCIALGPPSNQIICFPVPC